MGGGGSEKAPGLQGSVSIFVCYLRGEVEVSCLFSQTGFPIGVCGHRKGGDGFIFHYATNQGMKVSRPLSKTISGMFCQTSVNPFFGGAGAGGEGV